MRMRWSRAAVVRAYDVGDATVLIGSDGRAHELTGPSAALARAVLAHLAHPRTRDDVIAHIAELSGAPLDDTAVVDQLLALLRDAGAMVEAGEGSAPPRPPLGGTRVVLCLSGAVAAMHAPAMIVRLQALGCEVRVAATDNAARFVQPRAIEALLHAPMCTGIFEGQPEAPVPHIELAQWGDAVLVWPATASTLSRIATGDYGSVVSAIALTATCPVIVAPSMNAGMYAAPAVQRNVQQLVEDGFHLVHPAFGIEVADAPDERRPMLGPAPPPPVITQVLQTVLTLSRRRGPQAPRHPRQWDDIYRRSAPEDLPWHREAIDDDLAAVIAQHTPSGGAILDAGTGLGQVAAWCAEQGYRVVASDVSTVALHAASARFATAPVVWVEDDLTRSRLVGPFDAIVDRGCLHLFPPSRLGDYARTLARLTRPGGVLIVKHHEASSAGGAGTFAHEVGELAALLDGFELIHDEASRLPGPRDALPARLTTWRRV